jgi:hypothetical protein
MSGFESDEVKCVRVVDGTRGEEYINYNAVREGCASGFGKKVIKCNCEVRDGVSGVGVRGDGWRYGILFDTCIDIVSRIACVFVGYSQRPSQLVEVDGGGRE